MSWFGRRERRPKAMEWGSSFAEAEVLVQRRRGPKRTRTHYDGAMMASPPPGDEHRPIGSRRRDIAPPEAFGAAPPPLQRQRGIGRRILGVLLFLAALVLVGGLAWVALTFMGVGGGSGVEAGQPVKVVIPAGSSSTNIADILAKAGVVDNETTFRARLKLNGDGAAFKSGTYQMKTGSSYDTVVKTLEKGPAAAPTFDLTIVEGQRLEEIAASIDDKRDESQRDGGTAVPAFTGDEYLKAARALRPAAFIKEPAGIDQARRMEGLLFPATYELKLNATAEEFVKRQQATMEERLRSLNMARAAKANLTPYDVVIIASLIEREVKLDRERPIVAAVIWNRLKVGEPLGIDASNQYSVYEPGSDEFWESELKQSQLELDSPYNLRKVGGLPPTPIAAPGLASLEAAANPANVDYRYYLVDSSKSDGSHFFTNDYDEFLARQ